MQDLLLAPGWNNTPLGGVDSIRRRLAGVFGLGKGQMITYEDRGYGSLDSQLQHFEGLSPRVVIGFSMGGVLSWLAISKKIMHSPELLITIGSPLHCPASAIAHLATPWSKSAAELRRGVDLPDLPKEVRVLEIYGACDMIVPPPSGRRRSLYNGLENVELISGATHLTLPLFPRTAALCLKWMASATGFTFDWNDYSS